MANPMQKIIHSVHAIVDYIYGMPDESCKATSLRSVEACGPLQTSRKLQCMSGESCESGHSSVSGELN